MEGKRRFSERIAARQAALTNLSEKHGDELDEVNEPIIKRRALKKNHRKTTLSDGDKVFHGAAKISIDENLNEIIEAVAIGLIGGIGFEDEKIIKSEDLNELMPITTYTGEYRAIVSQDPINVLFLPHIIEKIFSHLQAVDIHNCGQVCLAWNEESTRWLEGRPILNCALVRKDMTCELESLRSSSKKKHLKMKDEVLETLKLQGFPIDSEITSEIELVHPATPPPRCNWWFAIRGLEIFPYVEVQWQDTVDSVVNFLAPKRIAPSLSFICLDNRFTDIPWTISQKTPAVVIQQRSLRITCHSERKIHEAVSTFVKKPRLFESLLHEKRKERTAIKCFNSLHVNGYNLDHKIVVTNWDDPSSERPDTQCSQYPIKAFIYLMGNSTIHERQIRKLLKNTTFPVSRGEVDYNSKLSYYDPDSCVTSSSDAISIAFTGHGVQSAVYQVSLRFVFDKSPPLTRIQAEIKAFRDKLEFPIDDGKVLGFVFEYTLGWVDRVDSLFERISDLFPSIELVRVKCKGNTRATFRLHLIRI